MSVNLKKNEKALLDAYNDVLSNKTDTNWVVFGYEGNSNDLKVVETGDGDLEEMVEELSGGKVMYAYIKVTDPNTQLLKNVLVNWSGEGVPANRKGTYARHTPDIARFFRGAHVTINARSEMDLDEDEVLKKVSTASGAKFGVHKEKARPMPAVGPVGSVYKKADTAINTKARDEFWSKQEKDEARRRVDEKKTAAEERKQDELERREREAQASSQRERAGQERARQIDEQKKQEAAAQRQQRDDQEAQLQARLKSREDEIESDRQREQREKQQQRVQEHSTISSAVRSKMSGFEEKAEEQTRPPPQRPPKRPVKAPPVVAREPSPPPREPTPPPREPTPPPREPTPPPREPTPPPREPTPPPREPTPPPREPTPEPEPDWDVEEPEQPMYDDVETPQQQQEDYYASEDQYPPEPEQPLYDDVENPVEPAPEAYYETAPGYGDDQEPDQPLYDDVQGPDEVQQESGGSGLTAKTVYDYEADDENELTFDVDEIITDIEQIDPGWWSGTRQLDGTKGLFPANYVELI